MVCKLKLIQFDAKRSTMTIVIESSLDLVNLFRSIYQGDVVKAFTTREIKVERASGKFDSRRIKVEIEVYVEKKSIDPLTKKVSFLGIIKDSSMKDLVGKHHSLHVKEGDKITVSGKCFNILLTFSKYYGAKGAEAICVLIDDESYMITKLGIYGIKVVDSGRGMEGKLDPDEYFKLVRKRFSRIIWVLENVLSKEDLPIIILGPQIIREEFIKFLADKPEIKSKIIGQGHSSNATIAGLNEAIRGDLRKFSDLAPVTSSVYVEELILRLAKSPERVCMKEDLMIALEAGAVEVLLIEERNLWKYAEEGILDRMLRYAESKRTKVVVAPAGTEAAEKLAHLGGIAGLLRYAFKVKDYN